MRCGQGRFDPGQRNAAFSRRTGIGLNFQVQGEGQVISAFEFCTAWEPSGWRLMFHLDPIRAAWPDHPKLHLQIEAPREVHEAPPFTGWRIPLAETAADRILEYLVSRIR